MFKNTFQSGFLSVLYSIGSKPLQIWDKKVRGAAGAAGTGRAEGAPSPALGAPSPSSPRRVSPRPFSGCLP